MCGKIGGGGVGDGRSGSLGNEEYNVKRWGKENSRYNIVFVFFSCPVNIKQVEAEEIKIGAIIINESGCKLLIYAVT